MLKTVPNSTIDVGWYGLPVAHRSRIKRFHLTRVYFKVIDDTSMYVKDIVLPQNSIKVRHYDVESPTNYQTIKHEAMTLSLKKP